LVWQNLITIHYLNTRFIPFEKFSRGYILKEHFLFTILLIVLFFVKLILEFTVLEDVLVPERCNLELLEHMLRVVEQEDILQTNDIIF